MATAANTDLATRPVSLAVALASYRAERNARSGLDYSTMSQAEVDRAMCDLAAHAGEELMELRMCLNRKAWKPLPSLRGTSEASLALRSEALEELADVLLMLDAFRDAAGFSLEAVQQAVEQKMAKNLVRQDHECNRQALADLLLSIIEPLG